MAIKMMYSSLANHTQVLIYTGWIDVEIDTHTRWGDVIIGQVITILDDEPSEVIHIRGHKKIWGYEVFFVLNASYELSESHYFIEGQIDVYRLQD